MNRQNIILVASAGVATALAMLAVPAIGQLVNQARRRLCLDAAGQSPPRRRSFPTRLACSSPSRPSCGGRRRRS